MKEDKPTREFGKRLAVALELADATAQELADALTASGYTPPTRSDGGVSRGTIGYWTRGEANRIPSDVIDYLETLLDQTKSYWYGIQEAPNWKPARNFRLSQRISALKEDLGSKLTASFA